MKKIFFITITFFSFLAQTYCFEAKIIVPKNEININNNFRIELQISDFEEDFGIKKINGIENFELLGQSISQKSFSNSVNFNGKEKIKTKQIAVLVLNLQAKEKGNFQLGPAIIDYKNKEIKSNIEDIKITGKNVFGIGKNKNLVEKKYDIKSFFSDKIKIYSFVLVIFVFIIFIFTIIFSRNYKQKLEKDNEKSKDDDFESKEEIIFPDLQDSDFLNKIEKTIKDILKNKYNLETKENLYLYTNLIEDEKNQEEFKNIISLFNKLKYSNLVVSKVKFLELIKKFNI